MKGSVSTPINRVTKPSKLKPAILATLLVGGIFGYGASSCRYTAQTRATSTDDTVIQVRFSPGGHCTQFVEETIAKAQKTILVQAYSFTSLPIADALLAAHQRGVEVKILVDQSRLTCESSQVRPMMEQGISVAVDKVRGGIAHNKVMIIDDKYVLTGSFNWTEAAERINVENLLLIKDSKINSIYKKRWQQRAKQAQAPEFGK